MKPALREFMAGLIDYAGLFPPAGLGMTAAVDEYARHLGDDRAWILGRFIVPASRLAELDQVLEESGITESWRYSLLVGDRANAAANLDILSDQGRQFRKFAASRTGLPGIETLECPLSAEVCGSGEELDKYLKKLLAGLVAADLGVPVVYLELPPDSDDELVIAALARAADQGDGANGQIPVPVAKLRCGGVSPEAFPTPERVATVLACCAEASVPLKCTAGLHHPLRHQAENPAVMMHGFVNIFGAGMLAHAAGLNRQQLSDCVAETDRDAFDFSAKGFSWRDHRISSEKITYFRRTFLHGFGSCSFAEPIADLRSWGLT